MVEPVNLAEKFALIEDYWSRASPASSTTV